MKKSILIFLTIYSFVIQKNSVAQDIPDTNLAQLIQQECPSCIDLASQNLLPPANNLDSLNLTVGVCVLNFQGLELLTALTSLKIDFPDPYTFSDCYINANGNNNIPLPFLPPNLSYLKITSFGSPNYNGNFNITLPQSIIELYLEGINVSISTFPSTLEKITLNNLNYNFGAYPLSLKDMSIFWAEGNNGFTLPSSVERLKITDWYGWDATIMGGTVSFNSSNSNLRSLIYDGESGMAGNYNIDLTPFLCSIV
jgi:hypothetical protein